MNTDSNQTPDELTEVEAIDVQLDRVERSIARFTPAEYICASWRNTLPVDDAGRIGIGFVTCEFSETESGELIRLSLDTQGARAVVETLMKYLEAYADNRSQAIRLGEMPSRDVSTPDAGANV